MSRWDADSLGQGALLKVTFNTCPCSSLGLGADTVPGLWGSRGSPNTASHSSECGTPVSYRCRLSFLQSNSFLPSLWPKHLGGHPAYLAQWLPEETSEVTACPSAQAWSQQEQNRGQLCS